MYRDFLDWGPSSCQEQYLPVCIGMHISVLFRFVLRRAWRKKGNVKFEVHDDVKVNAQSSLSDLE